MVFSLRAEISELAVIHTYIQQEGDFLVGTMSQVRPPTNDLVFIILSFFLPITRRTRCKWWRSWRRSTGSPMLEGQARPPSGPSDFCCQPTCSPRSCRRVYKWTRPPCPIGFSRWPSWPTENHHREAVEQQITFRRFSLDYRKSLGEGSISISRQN